MVSWETEDQGMDSVTWFWQVSNSFSFIGDDLFDLKVFEKDQTNSSYNSALKL